MRVSQRLKISLPFLSVQTKMEKGNEDPYSLVKWKILQEVFLDRKKGIFDTRRILLPSTDTRIKFSSSKMHKYSGLKEWRRTKASFKTIQNNNFFLTKDFESTQDRKILSSEKQVRL